MKHIPYFPDRLNGAYDFNSFEFFFFFYSDDFTQYRIQQKFYSKVLWMRVFLWHLSPTFKMTSLPNRIKLIYSHIFVNHLSFFPPLKLDIVPGLKTLTVRNRVGSTILKSVIVYRNLFSSVLNKSWNFYN